MKTKIVAFVCFLTCFLSGCSSDDLQVVEFESSPDAGGLEKVIKSFYSMVNPQSRGNNELSKFEFYSFEKNALSRSGEDRDFSVVTFNVGNKQGYAVIKLENENPDVVFFTENGDINDLNDVVAINDILGIKSLNGNNSGISSLPVIPLDTTKIEVSEDFEFDPKDVVESYSARIPFRALRGYPDNLFNYNYDHNINYVLDEKWNTLNSTSAIALSQMFSESEGYTSVLDFNRFMGMYLEYKYPEIELPQFEFAFKMFDFFYSYGCDFPKYNELGNIVEYVNLQKLHDHLPMHLSYDAYHELKIYINSYVKENDYILNDDIPEIADDNNPQNYVKELVSTTLNYGLPATVIASPRDESGSYISQGNEFYQGYGWNIYAYLITKGNKEYFKCDWCRGDNKSNGWIARSELLKDSEKYHFICAFKDLISTGFDKY